MKTAVSIPDELFQAAECAAADMGISRSRLYALAMAQYLKQRRDEQITEQINDYFAANPGDDVDNDLDRAGVESLANESW